MYDEADLSVAKLDLLKHTSMVDFYIEEYKKVYPDNEVPLEMTEKRTHVVEEFRRLQEESRPLLEIVEDDRFQSSVANHRDAKSLQDHLVKNHDLKRLQQFIDESTFGSSLQTLQQRTWLIHWSLFVFFNHPKGRDLIIELFLYQKQYLNAIQTMCPWILRYLSTAVVINKSSRRNVMLDLVKVIQEESYTYKDPITSFIEDLYVNFNFDGAQQKLRQCEEVLESDFFLVSCLNDFIENSRLMIFETFCRIH